MATVILGKDVYASLFLFRYIDMVIQNGTVDCGLFALASAAALANGEEPGSFAFDQEQMQPHLIKCLAAEKGEPFPVKKCRRSLFSALAVCLRDLIVP